MRLKEIGGMLLDVLFPKRCPWCGKVRGFTKKECDCTRNKEAVRLPDAAMAPRELDGREVWLGDVWACFDYDEPVRGMILRMKYEEEPELATPLGEELAKKYAACGLGGHYDLVVPVPMTAKAEKKRGYNQCLLMARRLAKAAGLPLAGKALAKTRQTKRQMTLARRERLENVAGAFAADAGQVAGKRVLLVDDVVTTGSTLNECARALLESGAVCCGALCVAASRPEYTE